MSTNKETNWLERSGFCTSENWSGPGPGHQPGLLSRRNQGWLKRAACVLLPVLALLLAGLVGGCATKQSYRTLKQTDIRVSSLMTHYRNATTFGMLTLGERQRVNAAYAAYEPAFKKALKAAGGNENVPTPENVKVLADEVIRVISSLPNIRR